MKTIVRAAACVAAAALGAGVWQVLAAPDAPPSTSASAAPEAPKHSVDVLLAGLAKVNKGQVDKREDQDRGFGARRLYLAIYPDCTYWISVLAVDGGVASVGITYSDSISDASWSRVVKALRGAGLTVPAAQASGAFGYYAFQDKALLSRLSRRVAAELGEPRIVTVPKNLRVAYDALMSPTSRLSFGGACGFAGTKPAGRAGAEALQKARRVDLLGNILRGPSPEGRVYAAQALLSLSTSGVALGEGDQAAIDKVKALPVLIDSCSGCVPMSQTAATLLNRAPAAQAPGGD